MIVHCTDAQACEWAGIANLEREDLNAIERAHWMRSMLDVAGYTQQKLADRLQATQGHISNMVRLLELPDAFQQRVISGEMPATWARHLCAWTHRPTVMAALMASKVKPHNEDHLCRLINSAVEECTRPLSGNFHDTDGVWRDVAFKATPAQLQELDLIEVKDRWWNGKHKRCFNLTLWAKLQAAGAARKAEREAKRAEKAGKAVGFNGDGRGGKVAAALARERAKEQAEQFAKRLYRWKISWLQGLLVEKLAALPGADADAMILRLLMHFTMQDTNQREAGELRKAITNAGGTAKVSAGYAQTVRAIPSLLTVPAAKLRSAALDLLRKWLAMPTDAYRAHLHSTDIEALADALGIVVKRDWKLSDAYLQLHTTAQLLSLCSEWRLPRENVRGLKRTELIAFILRNNPRACPDEVLKLRRPAGV